MGLDETENQSAGFQFPLTSAVMDHVATQRGSRNDEARAIAGAIIAGGLGWLLLEGYLAPILDLDHIDRDKLRKRMGSLLQSLVDV